ncbi:Suppressor of fused protein (SUFU) [compost metagenome]
MNIQLYKKENVIKHYISIWGDEYRSLKWEKGPFEDLGEDFCVLEFPPRESRDMWTYSTCCMSDSFDNRPMELHLFSPTKDDSLVELLTIIAHFHRFDEKLGLWHTVNFGKPWKYGSECSYGLISLPYLDGPELEIFDIGKGEEVHFYWLIPVTKAEVDYKKQMGIDRLEEMFEAKEFNYVDPLRKSIV